MTNDPTSVFQGLEGIATASSAGSSYATQEAFYYPNGKLAGIERNYANGYLQMLAIYNLDGSSKITNYDTFDRQASVIDIAANGSRTVTLDKYVSPVDKLPSSVEIDTFNSAGKIQTTDITLAFGVHNQTAQTAGVTLTAPSASATGPATLSTMHGSSLGSDTFYFEEKATNEIIYGFVAGNAANHDVIEISKSLAPDFKHLMADISNNNGDAYIHLGGGQSIFVHGVAASALTASDFHFV